MGAIERPVAERPDEREVGRMDLATWQRIADDHAWVDAHWSELAAYRDQWVAVCGGRVVLTDPDGRRFAARLRRSRYRDRAPFVLRVPTPEQLESVHPAAHSL